MKKYHRITEDTPNPEHDRRCRYGIESVASFPAGTIILETIRTEKFGGHEIPVSFYKIAGKWLIESTKLFNSLPTEPVEPTPEEIYISNYRGFAGERFIQTMIREGKLTIEAVEEYYNRPDEPLAS